MTEGSLTHISNVRIFDGDHVLEARSATIDGETIVRLGGPPPPGTEPIDGTGCTLLPGLIDSHTHATPEARQLALRFDVTTVCVMQGYWTPEQKKALDARRDLADALTSLFAVTAPSGHPHELLPKDAVPRMPAGIDPGEFLKYAATTEDARAVVRKRVAQDADYIKIMVEDGVVFGKPGTPDLSDEVLAAACDEAHRHGKMALVHAFTVRATRRALAAGVDGFMHLFIDQPVSAEMIEAIARSGVFVCPTIVAGASIIGDSDAADFARDERVHARLSEEWQRALGRHIGTWRQGSTRELQRTVKALHDAGVDILAGADASTPQIGGMAHGASLHHELALLVGAGLSPVEALRAATSVPARRFKLPDRGRIAGGCRADLLLVEGDPTLNIRDTLSIRGVWRQGVLLEEAR